MPDPETIDIFASETAARALDAVKQLQKSWLAMQSDRETLVKTVKALRSEVAKMRPVVVAATRYCEADQAITLNAFDGKPSNPKLVDQRTDAFDELCNLVLPSLESSDAHR
jgi:hypothetical protein